MENEKKGLMQRLKDSRPSTTTMVAAAAGVVIVGTVGYSIYKANQMAKRHGKFLDDLEQQAQGEIDTRLNILRDAADKGELKVVYNVASGELSTDPEYAARFALEQGMISEAEYRGVKARIDHLESTSAKEILDMKCMLTDLVSPVATQSVTGLGDHRYRFERDEQDRLPLNFQEPTASKDWLSHVLDHMASQTKESTVQEAKAVTY